MYNANIADILNELQNTFNEIDSWYPKAEAYKYIKADMQDLLGMHSKKIISDLFLECELRPLIKEAKTMAEECGFNDEYTMNDIL